MGVRKDPFVLINTENVVLEGWMGSLARPLRILIVFQVAHEPYGL